MSEPLRILSLGAGVQSSTLALMAACGELPAIAHAIFADTGEEPQSVYRWLDYLEKLLPFPVHRVSAGRRLSADMLVKRQRTGAAVSKEGFRTEWVRSCIPFFVLNPDGSRGQSMRQCTRDFKIRPIQRKVRELVHPPRGCKQVLIHQVIGISLDEAQRMKPSGRPWILNVYPFVERRITRLMCLEWMKSHGYPEPPRSACTFCPYHSDKEWRRLKIEEPEDFAQAVEFERKFQQIKSETDNQHGIPFLHSSLKPLDQVDFSSDTDRGQLSLWNDECEGMCGV